MSMKNLCPSLVCIAALVVFTVGRVEGQEGQPNYQAILNALSGVQAAVNSLQTKVETIQSHLDRIPRAWSERLPASERFQLIMGSVAVLDKETGLVWEQSPSAEADWVGAQIHCNNSTVGNRKGWRLPAIQELATLVDPTQFSPALPSGHPFSNVQVSQGYWSATNSPLNSSTAWFMNFQTGSASMAGAGAFTSDKLGSDRVWCVRGGQGINPQ
jgi:Protein of unknown function (DUF1566)